MKVVPYLNFNGQCEAAFKFYERCLGGQIVAMITHADMPGGAQASAEGPKLIMHARLISGELTLMGSDAIMGGYEPPSGVYVSLHVDDAETAERVYHALSEGGQVEVPIEETFFAVRFGMFKDRFGIPWMVNCEKPL